MNIVGGSAGLVAIHTLTARGISGVCLEHVSGIANGSSFVKGASGIRKILPAVRIMVAIPSRKPRQFLHSFFQLEEIVV